MFDIIKMVIKVRDILHCDLNSFFASVEMVKNPSLKKVPMAVCGDPKLRHGIILAKNEIAKKYGIYTPETVYSARKKCPNLVLVEGNYTDYKKFSKLVNKIYLKYTDRVEPFGIDESFLDITESKKLFGSPVEIAYKIKEEVKNTLGLTISVGVSFNKSLAKLGSDLKKPDAVSHIPYNNFKNIIFNLPVQNLLFVGKSTLPVLNKMGIYTIGQLANFDKEKLTKKLGKSGIALYNMANGLENDEVKKWGDFDEPKSISKGHTFPKDLDNSLEIEKEIKKLTIDIVSSLRRNKLKASVVGISIKNSNFVSITRSKHIESTNLYQSILNNILDLFNTNYTEGKKIRAVTVFLSNFNEKNEQLNLFEYVEKVKNEESYKLKVATDVLDNIQDIYGRKVINFGNLMDIN